MIRQIINNVSFSSKFLASLLTLIFPIFDKKLSKNPVFMAKANKERIDKFKKTNLIFGIAISH